MAPIDEANETSTVPQQQAEDRAGGERQQRRAGQRQRGHGDVEREERGQPPATGCDARASPAARACCAFRFSKVK